MYLINNQTHMFKDLLVFFRGTADSVTCALVILFSIILGTSLVVAAAAAVLFFLAKFLSAFSACYSYSANRSFNYLKVYLSTFCSAFWILFFPPNTTLFLTGFVTLAYCTWSTFLTLWILFITGVFFSLSVLFTTGVDFPLAAFFKFGVALLSLA